MTNEVVGFDSEANFFCALPPRGVSGCWCRRRARRRTINRQLDALGSAYRLAKEKQERVEELLAKSQDGHLTRAERRELNVLLRECDEIMLRRAEAMDNIL
jgi:hypothetical protein